jgi:hypothetical protein
LETVSILNASDLKDVTFACFLNKDKSFDALNFKYDAAIEALHLTPKTSTKVHDVISVHYGKQGDSNVCEGL